MTTYPATASATRVVFDGQSLNLIYGFYPAQLMAYFPTVPWNNRAVGSTSWDTLTVSAESRSLPVYPTKAANSILMLCGGTSDIETEADSGAEVYADYTAYCAQARTYGYTRILCTTTTPSSTWNAGQLSRLADANTLVKADASHLFDAIVDLAGDTFLGDPAGAGASYYTDGLHWNSTGAARAALLVQPSLAALIV